VGLLTVFNLANAVALVGGSLLGGAILYVMAETREAYLVLLVVSTVARIAALAFLVRMPATITKGAVSTIRAAPPPKPALIGQPALASHLAARLVGPHWDRKLPPLEHELQAEAATFRELSQLN
jgi:hypothetical protein